MPDHEVTIGEVYRRQQETLQEIRDMRRDLVGRAEYESDQEGIERRFADSADVHAEIKSSVAGLSSRMAAAEDTQRKNRAQITTAIITAVVGPVLLWLLGTIVGRL